MRDDGLKLKILERRWGRSKAENERDVRTVQLWEREYGPVVIQNYDIPNLHFYSHSTSSTLSVNATLSKSVIHPTPAEVTFFVLHLFPLLL